MWKHRKMMEKANTGFESFCGGPVWDWNSTWHTNHPDFTECFKSTVLVFVNCGWIWLISPLYFYILAQYDMDHHRERSRKHCAKLAFSFLMVIVSLADLIKGATEFQSGSKTYAAVFVSPLIQTLTFILVFIILNLEWRKGFITSGVLFLFYLILLFTGIVSLNSFINQSIKDNRVEDVFHLTTFVFYYALVFIQLVLACFADSNIEDEKMCPELASSFLSRATFWWMNSLVLLGYKKTLEEEDVWKPNPRDLVCNIAPVFEKAWQDEISKCKRRQPLNLNRRSSDKQHLLPNRSSEHESGRESNGAAVNSNHFVKIERPKKQASLLKILTKVYGFELFQAHLCKLFADVLVFVGPVLQSLLISYSQDLTVEAWKGYLYAALFLLTEVVNACFYQQMWQLGNTLGMRIKASLISAVYKKALTMSNITRKTTTVGEIVNLMSVDVQRLNDCVPFLWMVWSSPLQIIIAITLLYNIVGVSVFAGVGVMFLLFPINGLLANIESKFQERLMILKDQRIKIMSEILNGIKVLKLYAWELAFKEKVNVYREQELGVLKSYSYLEAFGTFSWTCAPFVVTIATFATYTMLGGVLNAQTAFTSLSLFNILRFPVSMLSLLISYIVTAAVSIKRLEKFLQTEDIDPNCLTKNSHGVDPVTIENGTFSWGIEEDDMPILENINISIPEGMLAAIVGPVGVGKSSLLSALLGEMERIDGSVNVSGSIAYVAQQAWIQNMTLRDNILFGSPYEEERYNQVLDACALRPDLEILPAADLTEIGEKGINLSGGQKQRVSLARAIYQNRDIYLLDDPLSAVDSHVGRQLFDNVLCNKGLLRNKTRLLVTHGVQFLPEVDRIIFMVDGKVVEMGSYKELILRKGLFARSLKSFLASKSNPDFERHLSETLTELESLELISNDDTFLPGSNMGLRKRLVSLSDRQQSIKEIPHDELDKSLQIDRLIQDEGGEIGAVKWSVFLSYCKALGSLLSVVLVIVFALSEVSSVISSVWLSQWTEDSLLQNSSLVNTSMYTEKRDMYLGVYGALGSLQTLFVLIYSLVATYCLIKASRQLHEQMLDGVLRSPLMFFDTTPMGRILNRFSRDIETIDNNLPETTEQWMMCFFSVIATFAVICYSTPIFIAVVIPLFVLYYIVQRFYIPTSRQLKRLESKTRSPIYVHFSETISGASTIRAYGVQREFIQQSEEKVDNNLVFFYGNISSNRWLGFRLQFLGAVVVTSTALLAVLGRGVITGSLVGLSISYALQVTEDLNWFVRMTTDLETNMVSVERIKEYVETPSEAEWYGATAEPARDWPQDGQVTFRDYSTRYRPGLDPVLKKINFEIKAGEKIGIVGRTGAGKSSLTLALFRMIEATEGDIIIDGINLSKLGLHRLRSRLTILPQDPVLFSGTLRLNLDPLDKYSDDVLWPALEHAHLKEFVQNLPAGLDYECGEGGHNLSVGQRQLVCLARTLLHKSKILVLDEATAAVDLETDELIQETIRVEFADCTVLTIAHRLNTIMDSDRVMVLDMGEVKEFETPNNLLRNTNSLFYKMAQEAKIV